MNVGKRRKFIIIVELRKLYSQLAVQSESVADYSGKNVDDVLERAKRFEMEVLQKLRKQTSTVLFDNEFDDSLEFSTSLRQVSAEPLSTGSLTDDSLSTGKCTLHDFLRYSAEIAAQLFYSSFDI